MNNLGIKIATTDQELKEAYAIRHAVFTAEQNIPEEIDNDGKDARAINILAKIENTAIGTGRLYPVNEQLGELARIAVLKKYRGAGIAKEIIIKLEVLAKEKGLKELILWPHERLNGFYTSLGFELTPDRQIVAGYPLIKMRKVIG